MKDDYCNCVTEINQQLQRDAPGCYLRTFTSLATGKTKPAIATERRIGKGKKPPMFISVFCPFCGVKYPEPETIPIGKAQIGL